MKSNMKITTKNVFKLLNELIYESGCYENG